MYRKILLAIDYEDDEAGKRAIEEGAGLLDAGGELHLATVFSPGTAGFFPHVQEASPAQHKQQLRDRLTMLARKYQPAEQSSARLHVLTGSPGESLVALAAQLEVELIVLVCKGTGSRWWPLGRATVEYVTVKAPCAVLTLPALVQEPLEPIAPDN